MASKSESSLVSALRLVQISSLPLIRLFRRNEGPSGGYVQRAPFTKLRTLIALQDATGHPAVSNNLELRPAEMAMRPPYNILPADPSAADRKAPAMQPGRHRCDLKGCIIVRIVQCSIKKIERDTDTSGWLFDRSGSVKTAWLFPGTHPSPADKQPVHRR